MIVKIYRNVVTINSRPLVARVVRVYNHRIANGITETSFSAKGGLLLGTGVSTYTELPVGANNKVLTADSAQPSGAKWDYVNVSSLGSGLVTNTEFDYLDGVTSSIQTQLNSKLGIAPRVSSETSSATPTINTNNVDAHSITALAVAITSMTTNLSGSPSNFQKLTIRIKDNGTARAITWGASFESKGVALPTFTVVSQVMTVNLMYDSVTAKWGCMSVEFQNKFSSETSSATPTINVDAVECHSITALATAITSFTTNLTGTPVNFQKLTIRIKDNGTARAITWGASFEARGIALPTTTVISKVLTVGFIYDSVSAKWGCVASAQEA